MYWRGEDILTPATTPPLQHWLSGWVPLLFDVPLMRDSPEWEGNNMYGASGVIFRTLEGDRAHWLIFLSRLPFVVFPLGIAWLLRRWGSELFDLPTGNCLAIASLLEPNLLAHASLIKSDVAAAFGLLWIAYACWRFWKQPGHRSLCHLALAVAVGAQTKFTVLPMIPFAMAAINLRYLILRRWKLAFLAPLAVLLAAYLTLIVAYQFDYSRSGSNMFSDLYLREAWKDSEIEFMKRFVVLPVPLTFASGVHYIWRHGSEEGQAAYMLGKAIETPEPLYFFLTLAVKYPIPLQFLLIGGLAVFAARLYRRQNGAADFFIWAPAFLVFGLSLQSKILVGFRYIFPCLPLFMLAGGFLFHEWRSRGKQRSMAPAVAALLCMGWLLVGAAGVYPQGISYFNEWVGGPDNGWKYLADSNVDWGQDLPRLATYVRAHKLERVQYAYFGRDVPDHYDFGAATMDSMQTPYCVPCIETAVFAPTPGMYAISVNMLLGLYWEEPFQDYFRYFREREPDAKAGESIFIFEVTSPKGLAHYVPTGTLAADD
jgi:hypothetical protein